MRRLIIGPVEYFRELGNAAVRGWNAFFFTPADPTSLGLLRVAVGLLLLWSLGVYGLDLQAFFGSEGWADPKVIRHIHERQSPAAWSFWLLVPDHLLRPAWVGCMGVLLLYTVGLFSRVTSVLAWVIVVSTTRRMPVSLFGFDQVISTWALYLALTGASGQAVSLDRFFARYRQTRALVTRRRHDGRWMGASGVPTPTISANLALRLIQLHLVLIYGMAGLAKLQGQAWWSGMAIWGVLAAAEFRELDLTWLAAYPWLLNVMTHGSLALELGYPVLIWTRALRPLLLGTVVLLHFGIALTAPGLSEFGLVMLAGNLAFVSGPWLRSLVAGKAGSQPAGKVLYDGACPRCRASMALLTAGDPDRVLEPVDLTAVDVTKIHPSLTKEDCLRAMHVVRADGRIAAGYRAVMLIGRWIPLFKPAALVGSLPILSQVGDRVYNRIAASRPRDFLCNDDVCGIHPHAPVADTERAHL
ncbi:DCC1-like thiol-disulfide oxidoreductase family protein [Singulisphaera sp. PoT]|uniref:DCC1-like thiol-disulfide oxidoreductase family protein n=1 Tax=Singulisphaera sp. PoT TaxID=3411797 RepID=UPI003BF5B521